MSRVKDLRERAGLSQGELAERVGIAQGYLSRIEGGKRPGSIQVLRRIASELHVGLSDLFEKDGRDQLFMGLLDELLPDQQDRALEMLEAFVKAVKKQPK